VTSVGNGELMTMSALSSTEKRETKTGARPLMERNLHHLEKKKGKMCKALDGALKGGIQIKGGTLSDGGVAGNAATFLSPRIINPPMISKTTTTRVSRRSPHRRPGRRSMPKSNASTIRGRRATRRSPLTQTNPTHPISTTKATARRAPPRDRGGWIQAGNLADDNRLHFQVDLWIFGDDNYGQLNDRCD
jgi:hypothetical protein